MSSAYYITPPSSFMPTDGVKITLIGYDEEGSNKELMDLMEETFPALGMTFYHVERPEPSVDQFSWLFQQCLHSDFVVVDIENATAIEIGLATYFVKDKGTWWVVSDEDALSNTFLHAIKANTVDSAESFVEMIKETFTDDR